MQPYLHDIFKYYIQIGSLLMKKCYINRKQEVCSYIEQCMFMLRSNYQIIF